MNETLFDTGLLGHSFAGDGAGARLYQRFSVYRGDRLHLDDAPRVERLVKTEQLLGLDVGLLHGILHVPDKLDKGAPRNAGERRGERGGFYRIAGHKEDVGENLLDFAMGQGFCKI